MHIFVGFDAREAEGYEVCKASILRHSPSSVVHPIHLDVCQILNLYKRPYAIVDGKPYDPISQAPMSTEFALSRFLVPWLAEHQAVTDQWVLFCDLDMLFRFDVDELLKYADDRCAVMVVKHEAEHTEGKKMDGCEQTMYPRKNWSSVILWNLNHEGHNRLTLEDVNRKTGLWLHRLYWLKDSEIGELPKEYNHLVSVNPPNAYAKIVHYTLGIPTMDGYERCEYADEWFDIYDRLG